MLAHKAEEDGVAAVEIMDGFHYPTLLWLVTTLVT
jgi:hypothetical protein